MAKKSAAATNKARYEQIAEELAAPITEEAGVYIYDVDYHKEGEDFLLCVYIDKEGGVTIDDCETVSRALEPVLDEADPIEQAYTLSVSSLGLDRPLKLPKDYERNLGKPIEVKLYSPLKMASGKSLKQLHGTLVSYDEASFVLRTEGGKDHSIQKKDAALIRPYIEF